MLFDVSSLFLNEMKNVVANRFAFNTTIRPRLATISIVRSLAKKSKEISLPARQKSKNVQIKRRLSKIYAVQNLRSFFTFWLLFFEVLKTKTTCQTLRPPS